MSSKKGKNRNGIRRNKFSVRYYKNGKLHREDGPAEEYVNGTKCWWIEGKRHRIDGPAIENANLNNIYYMNGEKCRRTDLPGNVEPLHREKPMDYIDPSTILDLTKTPYKPRQVAAANMLTVKLCHLLINADITFDVEYNPAWYIDETVPLPQGGRRGSRFDVAIIRDNFIVGIIETKYEWSNEYANQVKRYEMHRVPVFLCKGEAMIDEAFKFAQSVYNAPETSHASA